MGAALKNKSKKPWASIFTLSPCGNRCHFSESVLFFSQVHPPSKNKLITTDSNTKVTSGEAHVFLLKVLGHDMGGGGGAKRMGGERQKRTLPPPKENLLENFSCLRLKEKLSTPAVDTKSL